MSEQVCERCQKPFRPYTEGIMAWYQGRNQWLCKNCIDEIVAADEPMKETPESYQIRLDNALEELWWKGISKH